MGGGSQIRGPLLSLLKHSLVPTARHAPTHSRGPLLWRRCLQPSHYSSQQPSIYLSGFSCDTRGFRTAATSQPAKEPVATEFFNGRLFPTQGEVFQEEAIMGDSKVTFETGKIARFCAGAVVASLGNTKVLATVVCANKAQPDCDFLPLQVDYREKQSAGGNIPRSFMRREGAPKEREILCSRIIDRSIRPLFPKGFFYDIQVAANVLSADGEIDPDILCVNAASAALMISDVPWAGPVGAVRVVRVGGKLIVNPTMDQLVRSDLNLVYACTQDNTVMIETQAAEISNLELSRALGLAHVEARKLLAPQRRLQERVQFKKREVALFKVSDASVEKVRALGQDALEEVLRTPSSDKMARGKALGGIEDKVAEVLRAEGDEATLKELPAAFEKIKKEVLRRNIFEKELRVDGRGLKDIRPIQCEVGNMAALHGFSLFSRGNTQTLCTVTVGAQDDAQKLDGLVGPSTKRFMVHYSFPHFAVNEIGRQQPLNRREVGHGTLAEKALITLLPPEDDFPLSIRVTSDCTASDGSSSMATVCGGSLALMDAGVPLKDHVAGVSIGLVTDYDYENQKVNEYRLLTDILGLEDHLGDMDFKIAGTRKGVTAIQLDIKLPGIPLPILCNALEPALEARCRILDHMERHITTPRKNDNSPRFGSITIDKSMIGRLIGTGGAGIRAIQEDTGVRVSIDDYGTVQVFAKDQASFEAAIDKIEAKVGKDIEVGGVYNATVVAIKDFGAMVELETGISGLVHISEVAHHRVMRVEDVLQEGQPLMVECIGKDLRGNLRFSRKSLLPAPTSFRDDPPEFPSRPWAGSRPSSPSPPPPERAPRGDSGGGQHGARYDSSSRSGSSPRNSSSPSEPWARRGGERGPGEGLSRKRQPPGPSPPPFEGSQAPYSPGWRKDEGGRWEGERMRSSEPRAGRHDRDGPSGRSSGGAWGGRGETGRRNVGSRGLEDRSDGVRGGGEGVGGLKRSEDDEWRSREERSRVEEERIMEDEMPAIKMEERRAEEEEEMLAFERELEEEDGEGRGESSSGEGEVGGRKKGKWPTVGEEYEGKVKSLRKSGVVVDVAGMFDAVLKVDQEEEGNLSAMLQRGQDVRVRCVSVTPRGKPQVTLVGQ